MTTVRKIYRLALARIMESPGNDADFDTYSPDLLEQLLVEALPYENPIRRQAGRPLLERAPEVTAIDDTELEYDDRIARLALPYGLAGILLSDDESRKAESVMMRNEYLTALDDAAPGIFETDSGEDGD